MQGLLRSDSDPRFTCSDVSCRGNVRARYGCVPVTSIRAGGLRQRKGIADRSRCHADRWQVYRLELYFRQGYDFSSSARHEVGGAPGGFLLGEPASLRFNGGKIILYGTTTRQPSRKHATPSGFGRIGLCLHRPRERTRMLRRFRVLTSAPPFRALYQTPVAA